MVGGGHNLPARQYPIVRARHVFHQPRHRQHSFRKRLGRRPRFISLLKSTRRFESARTGEGYEELQRKEVDGNVGACKKKLTSGNVPLEKTLDQRVSIDMRLWLLHHRWSKGAFEIMVQGVYSHQ